MPDLIKEPPHYARWAIQPIEFITKNDFEFWRGNIVKYATRAGYKGDKAAEIADLNKVQQYAQIRINTLEGRGILND
tara:strand:- start:378 stop:608 length:231 start_codon:yes stop_codon:yes gene_type:complete